MGKPEGAIESYLVKRVKETGGHIRKLAWIGRRAAPDRIIWWGAGSSRPPLLAFVEAKAPGEGPTPAQAREHARMRADGLCVCVVSTKDEVDALVRDRQRWAK